MNEKKVELLAPAGSLETLKVAVLYGADAVYVGGMKYGLRAKAKNLSIDDLREGITFAHEHGVKVYITVNIIAHNEDFQGLEEYFLQVAEMGANALIIADPGIFSVAKKVVPDMEIHLSTQANNTNYKTVQFWYEHGIKRIVVARELSLREIKEIREKVDQNLDLEAFIHGAMCMSYSGRCMLSNFLTGRDANQGECSHPCRWRYHLVEEKRPGEYMPVYEDERGTHIFNSKDLCMIEYIPELIQSGIYSFKIEGRMKTPLYIATVIQTYRRAIDDYYKDPKIYQNKLSYYKEELDKSSHRDYTTGFYHGKPTAKDHIYDKNENVWDYTFVGIVLNYDSDTKIATIEQRNKFSVGDEIEFLTFSGDNFKMTVDEIWNEEGGKVPAAPHPKEILRLKIPQSVRPSEIIRKKK